MLLQKIQVVRVKGACPPVFSEDLPVSGASDAAADELGSGLVDAVNIDIRTFYLRFHFQFQIRCPTHTHTLLL